MNNVITILIYSWILTRNIQMDINKEDIKQDYLQNVYNFNTRYLKMTYPGIGASVWAVF